MVPALRTPRPKHVLGGGLSKIRREILRQAQVAAPSLYDPLTGDSRGGDVVTGAIRAMIETCADRKTSAGCCHVTADLRRCRFVPTHGPRQTGKPSPSASVTVLAFYRSCSARLRRRFPPVSRFRRCRRSQVSGKRSKPLTSYRRKHKNG